MKRFLIPAFFVVDVPDDKGTWYADSIAAEMQSAANKRAEDNKYPAHLLLDEVYPTVEIPLIPEDDLPHTCLNAPACRKCGAKVLQGRCIDTACPYSSIEQTSEPDSDQDNCPYCDSGIVDSHGNCGKCGL